MRRVMQKIVFFYLLLSFLIALFSVTAWATDSNVISFRWSAMKSSNVTNADKINIIERPIVTNGDRLQFVIQPINNLYIYIFVLDSDRRLLQLFPPYNSYESFKLSPGTEYFIPGPDDKSWLQVDDTKGKELFYLLASHSRLFDLEKKALAFKDLSSDSNDNHDEYLKKQFELLEEIKHTHLRFSKLTSQTEKGVSIAGNIRTRGVSLKNDHMTRVDAVNFYSKTLRLKHE